MTRFITRRILRTPWLPLGLLLAIPAGCRSLSGTIDIDDGVITFNFDLPRTRVERETTTRPVAGLSTLRVNTRNGSVDVRIDRSLSQALIETTRFATGRNSAEADELLAQVRVNITQAADVLEINVEFPPPAGAARDLFGSGGGTGCSVTVRLPAGLILELATANGPVSVRDNQGRVRAATSNGRIRIQDQAGDAELETSNGSIEVLRAAGNVRGRTSNGSIIVRANPPAGGSIDLETSNGRIEIEVPRTTAASIDLATSNARLTLDLVGFVVTQLQQTQTTAIGVLNGGGGTIRARTSNAPITFGGF
jgi:hypothetical protein